MNLFFIATLDEGQPAKEPSVQSNEPVNLDSQGNQEKEDQSSENENITGTTSEEEY